MSRKTLPHREIRIVWDLSAPLPKAKTPEGFVIVPARRPDIPPLAALAVEAYRGPWDWWLDAIGVERAQKHFRESLETLASTPAAAILVSRSGGRLAGAIAVTASPEDNGDRIAVCGLVVGPDFRGRGLGKALLREALEWLRKRGIKSAQVTTTASLEGYPPAVRAYLHFGGRIAEERAASGDDCV